jgi:hypothetical protein
MRRQTAITWVAARKRRSENCEGDEIEAHAGPEDIRRDPEPELNWICCSRNFDVAILRPEPSAAQRQHHSPTAQQQKNDPDEAHQNGVLRRCDGDHSGVPGVFR